MEQSKCLVWFNKKHTVLGEPDDHLPPTKNMKRFNRQQSYCSWEDQEEAAFAEDTAGGTLGGTRCIWPPRSYSCSFCKREFRSAQALGGHMNVHRRDRALLKQVTLIDPSPPLDHHHHHHHLHLSQSHHLDQKSIISKSPAASNPSQLCLPRTSVAYLSHNYVNGVTRVTSSNAQQVKMCTGLDFATGQYRKDEKAGGDEEEYLSSKRSKKSDDHVALLPFFAEVKCSNVEGAPDHIAIKSMEDDLDLELRLGDPLYKAK